VAVETRALDNAARILSRQVLARFVDYQIDYDAGTLLLKQPVPAADTYGNPVFLVVLYEAESGGPKSEVWGVRASVNGKQLIRSAFMDSLRMGATWVHESRAAGDHELLGTDLRLLRGHGLELGGELSWSRGPDSSGVATSLDGSLALLRGAAHLSANWLGVGREFGNPSNPALRGGTSELKLGAQWKQGGREFNLGHEWQRFDVEGMERQRTTGSVLQPIGTQVQVLGTLAAEHFRGPGLNDGTQSGELKVSWKPSSRLSMWTEGRHEFGGEGAMQRPDYLGAGAAFEVNKSVSLEARYRRAFLPGDSGSYSVTDLGIRSKLGFGTEAYGSYQIAGVSGAHNAALVGLRNHLQVGQSWSLNALFERRMGLNRASSLDPVRALPFLQLEEDYWSLGLGAEFLPQRAPYRLSARAELRNGDVRSNRLLTLAGDVSLNRSLALLSRQDLAGTEQNSSGLDTKGHRYSSLWGLAFRPTHSDALNVLTKFEWIDAENQNAGSVLGGTSGEGRTIFATEGIYQPSARSELAARFALRRSVGSLVAPDGTSVPLRSLANFVGWRASAVVLPLLEVRAEGRLLMERTSGTNRYDIAPQLAFLPQRAVEIVAGYRFGDLRDPDFAVNGGHGWFVTFGARVTERTVASAADFWRQRLAGH
jgi:hypothetical protein